MLNKLRNLKSSLGFAVVGLFLSASSLIADDNASFDYVASCTGLVKNADTLFKVVAGISVVVVGFGILLSFAKMVKKR